tara:strand:+ start:762 stop:1253 length:492 start_codon:yes stop_codon:yes gene_type:complete
MKSYMGRIPNRHVRDFQRNTLYDAESKCSFWNNFSILPIDDVHTLINDISKTFGIKKPIVKLSSCDFSQVAVNDILLVSGTEPIYATQSKIVLPFPIAQSRPVICHEMSHVINYQLGPADHHGPNFAKVYLEVVHEFIGEEEYKELKHQFDLLGVRYEEVVLV